MCPTRKPASVMLTRTNCGIEGCRLTTAIEPDHGLGVPQIIESPEQLIMADCADDALLGRHSVEVASDRLVLTQNRMRTRCIC